ncbi:MAG: hypothetical protein HYX72_13245 [Acidobacteria bacterium]|nr:hypothetical protein [Acidobacteriota bacterium]
MKNRVFATMTILTLALFSFPGVQAVRGDKLVLKDGRIIEGTIVKVGKGQVTMDAGGETTVFDIPQIGKMEFDIPALETGTSRLPLEHFQAAMEQKEMLQHVRAVEDSATEVRLLIEQTKKEWTDRSSVGPRQAQHWDAAKELFRGPVLRYQEVLNDLYFHVLGKVDEYNRQMRAANAIYVGVKGWFNAGSPLISKEMQKLPLKKYVPSNWYDTIFFEGYARGYNEAYEKYSTSFHLPYEPPTERVTPRE